MSRTTLDIDGSVLEQLRSRAAAENKSMGQVASEVLATGLGARTPPKPPRLRWPSHDMGTPRIDLEDKEALWKFLDAEQLDEGLS